MSKNDEIKAFLVADKEEMEKRYKRRMGINEISESEMEGAPEKGADDIDVSAEVEETNTTEKQDDVFEYDEDESYNNDEYESHDYNYTEETAYKRGNPVLIDKEPRQDEEMLKLPKPKTMSQIEGNIEVDDKERGIIFTSFYNKKDSYQFNRLYDVSGEKPVLLASGRLDYKDGMFIVNYPPKQPCYDSGDDLKYMQSALYKLDTSNKPHFVAGNVVEILNDGWFEQSSGKDYSVYLCKDENAGKYRRIMNFGADASGHREVTADGTIIDELDRTDLYHKDEYKYDAKKHTLKFVKGKGYESDEYDYDERHGYSDAEDSYEVPISQDIKKKRYLDIKNGQENGIFTSFCDAKTNDEICTVYSEYDLKEGRDYIYDKDSGKLTINKYESGVIVNISRNEDGQFSVEEQPMSSEERKKGLLVEYADTKFGTFFYSSDCDSGGTFVRKDGTEDKTLVGGGFYGEISVGSVLPNGLANVNKTTYSASSFGGWGRKSGSIYDFKTSSYRDDLEEIKNIGDKFYAVKKKDEEKFGIYEAADEDMKNPLMMVDDCKLVTSKNILFSIGDAKLRCEVTPEGRLKPIAKQNSRKELYLSTGGQWVRVDLKEDTRAGIDDRYISLNRGEYYIDNGIEYLRKSYDYILLSNEEAKTFAHSIAKTVQTEKVDVLKEGYHNAKERVMARLQELYPNMKAEEIKSKAKAKAKVNHLRSIKGRDLG